MSRPHSMCTYYLDELAQGVGRLITHITVSSVKNQPSITDRKALGRQSIVVSCSARRRYTVSSRCSGVSVSEICTWDVAKPSRRDSSSNHRAKKGLPLPYSPRTALNSLARHARRRARPAGWPRSAQARPPGGPSCWRALSPRLKASSISSRRCGLMAIVDMMATGIV